MNEEIYGINPTNDREMTFYELLKEIIEKKDEQKSILEEKLDNFDITNFLENIEKIFNEETEINIIKGKVLNELREYIREKEENNSDYKLKQIYNLELKKYIENNFSYKKQKSKSKNGKKEKFKNKINSNFKNLFVQHILDYGKLLYYKENDEYIKNTGQLETKDLEYIKTKETLIRKMAVLVSFAANSYYNLFGRTENNILTQEISDDLLLGKVENERYIKGERNRKYVFKEKMLNYFKWLGTFAFVSEEYNFGLYMPIYSIKERIIRIGISLLFLVITYFYIFYTPIWKIKFFLKRLFKIKEKNSENIRVVEIGYIKGGIDKNGRF